jgi:hypothetical protein
MRANQRQGKTHMNDNDEHVSAHDGAAVLNYADPSAVRVSPTVHMIRPVEPKLLANCDLMEGGLGI